MESTTKERLDIDDDDKKKKLEWLQMLTGS